MDPLRMRLERSKAALLVVDIQERLCPAMAPERLARVLNRSAALIEGAKALGLPVVVTEQYPKGLGPTHPAIAGALPEGVKPIEKIDFSCAVADAMQQLAGRSQVLICGMEAHVCVFQTARDLVERGLVPFLCADAVCSRTEEDRALGIERCREVGAVITSAEGALFDLLGRAGTPEFKRISAAVK
jgi:nicotinamidase-related amidase